MRDWGAHYLRSLSRAHFAQVCNNFKVRFGSVLGLFQAVAGSRRPILWRRALPRGAGHGGGDLFAAQGAQPGPAEPGGDAHGDGLRRRRGAIDFRAVVSGLKVRRALDYAHDDMELAAQYLMEGGLEWLKMGKNEETL